MLTVYTVLWIYHLWHVMASKDISEIQLRLYDIIFDV